ncbi:secreted protein [sediment metagenome]|uniref:Secreted protein n=1 Tax=sediment metagenome TaxID=749907 RepID=D9PKE4_9ZZZZ
MRAAVVATLLIAVNAPAWGQSCVDPSDPEARRWFQDGPCPAGMVDMPLPVPPRIAVLIDDAPPAWGLPGWPATDGSRVYRWGRPHRDGGYGPRGGEAGRYGPAVGLRGRR